MTRGPEVAGPVWCRRLAAMIPGYLNGEPVAPDAVKAVKNSRTASKGPKESVLAPAYPPAEQTQAGSVVSAGASDGCAKAAYINSWINGSAVTSAQRLMDVRTSGWERRRGVWECSRFIQRLQTRLDDKLQSLGGEDDEAE